MEFVETVAITLILLTVGATIFMWRKRMLRSRAALASIAVFVAGLIYVAYSLSGAAV